MKPFYVVATGTLEALELPANDNEIKTITSTGQYYIVETADAKFACVSIMLRGQAAFRPHQDGSMSFETKAAVMLYSR